MIGEIFSPEEVELTCQLPTSVYGFYDRQIWWYSPNGTFIVHSGYYLEISHKSWELSSQSLSSVEVFPWKSIWSQESFGTIKNFIWHACHNILLTLANLVSQKIITLDHCSVCLRFLKIVIHAL